MVTFTGQCLVHRAEILQLHGLLPAGEVYRVLGDFTAAEDAYQQASGRRP